MERCANTEALNRHLQEQEDSDAAYEYDIQAAKELLEADMDTDGLDSVLDCISKDEKHHIELIGKVFLLALHDGGLMNLEIVNAKELVERLVLEDDELMEELAYWALQKPNFAQRVNDASKPEGE